VRTGEATWEGGSGDAREGRGGETNLILQAVAKNGFKCERGENTTGGNMHPPSTCRVYLT
jgi:hypothetical protein